MFEMNADDEVIIRNETVFFYFASLCVLLFFELHLLAWLYGTVGIVMFIYDDEEDDVEPDLPEITTYRDDGIINYPYLPDLLSEIDVYPLLEEAPENMDPSYLPTTPESWNFEQEFQHNSFDKSLKEFDRFNFFLQTNGFEEKTFKIFPVEKNILSQKFDINQRFSEQDLHALEAYLRKNIIKKNYTKKQLNRLYYQVLEYQNMVQMFNDFLLQSQLTRGIFSKQEFDFKIFLQDPQKGFEKCKLIQKFTFKNNYSNYDSKF